MIQCFGWSSRESRPRTQTRINVSFLLHVKLNCFSLFWLGGLGLLQTASALCFPLLLCMDLEPNPSWGINIGATVQMLNIKGLLLYIYLAPGCEHSEPVVEYLFYPSSWYFSLLLLLLQWKWYRPQVRGMTRRFCAHKHELMCCVLWKQITVVPATCAPASGPMWFMSKTMFLELFS